MDILLRIERNLKSEKIKLAMTSKKLLAGDNYHQGRPSKQSKEMIDQVLNLHNQGFGVREIERHLGRQLSRSTISRILQQNNKVLELKSDDPNFSTSSNSAESEIPMPKVEDK
ncbi:MAG: helix-turn-helix domain-containing protein [Oligoflexia bacterium]|nr:helix-turn-helix domain-containing protein [Oligoflexia bacterium]